MSEVAEATDMGVLLLALMTLWLYLPGFIANTFAMMWGKWLPKTGYGPWPIDGGRTLKDGNRMLGDGKTWNGLIGGSLTAGLLCMLQVALVGTTFDEASVFVSPLTGSDGAWFSIGGPWLTAYVLGTFLGFACLVGDMTGSFFKRRRGLKREGEVSSKAPLLDTPTVRNHGVSLGSTFPRIFASRIFRIAATHGDHCWNNSNPASFIQPHWLRYWLERRTVLNREGLMSLFAVETPCELLHFWQYSC